MLSDNKKRVIRQTIMLSTVAVSTLLWCGCRSVPGLNRFARISKPSADVLAGTGPSATYPAPPSVSATPQAIASVAGGTKAPSSSSIPTTEMPSIGPSSSPQTAQVAGIDVSPGYATPATNYAAANANGVYSKPSNNVSANAKPSAYTFGSKTFTPKTTPETPTAMPVSNNGSAGKSSYAKSSFGMPSTTAGIANSIIPGSDSIANTKYTTPPSASPPTATSIAGVNNAQSGFTLPTNMPGTAVAAIAPPSTATSTASGTTTSFGMPGMDVPAPAYSTANSTGGVSTIATSNAPTSPSGGYMPGSTGVSSVYPGSEQDAPATSGSYYR